MINSSVVPRDEAQPKLHDNFPTKIATEIHRSVGQGGSVILIVDIICVVISFGAFTPNTNEPSATPIRVFV